MGGLEIPGPPPPPDRGVGVPGVAAEPAARRVAAHHRGPEGGTPRQSTGGALGVH